MRWKEIVVIAGLGLIIVVAGVFIIWWCIRPPIRMPSAISEKPTTRIDLQTRELVTLPYVEWYQRYGVNGQPGPRGRFKNPKTGEFTMVNVRKCGECKADIPVTQFPDELQSMGKAEADALIEKTLHEEKCPVCGKNPNGPPYNGQSAPPPPE